MRKVLVLFLSLVCLSSSFASAEVLSRATVVASDGSPMTAVLEKSSGVDYSVVALRAGPDTMKVLVDHPYPPTVRVNGYQVVFSPAAFDRLAAFGWEGLSEEDQSAAATLSRRLYDPVGFSNAFVGALGQLVSDPEETVEAYDPASSTPGCGIGGNCSDEAWSALTSFLACAANQTELFYSIVRKNPAGIVAGAPLALQACSTWNDAHNDFERCCHNGPGSEGDDPVEEADDDCHCLGPDEVGPNPPCCDE